MRRSIFHKIFPAALFLLGFFFVPQISSATSLSVSPAAGTYSVGSTFEVSILLDTEGKSINAFQAYITFPKDKLQIVSPSTGKSVVGVWTVPPKFNNFTGTVELEGGIPGGIIASKGVLTNITFKVKSTGEGAIKFLDKSRVFLDDGLATDDLHTLRNGVFRFRLPPPGGPIVSSGSHPDESLWYSNSTASLYFREALGVEGFSYVLSDDLVTIPDNISEGSKDSIIYNNLSDGLHYFHIKAMRAGVWGGVTHFAIRVDTTPPAMFPVEILPRARTSEVKPVITFGTTDTSSGLDHYELKIEPLSPGAVKVYEGQESFFIDATSPLVTAPLELGSYVVTVRAFDRAGNVQEVTERLTITTPLFSFISERGIQIKDWFLIPWLWVWIIGAILLLLLLILAYKAWHWRRHHETHLLGHPGPEPTLPEDVVKKLEELKTYREKYGSKVAAVLLLLCSLWSFGISNNKAQAAAELAPPLITEFSKDISNKEIFYIGGKAEIISETIILYFQNLLTGETTSHTVEADKNGDWFYRHESFLSAGEYLLWAQASINEQVSPPSPQVKMQVRRTAIEFGGNRLSYEVLYLIFIILLLVLLIGLSIFILFHYYHGKRHRREFEREVREVEESIKRGFAVLKKDIEGELEIVRRANLGGALSLEEKEKEAQLLNDLNTVQKRIGREVWEIKKESW